MSAFQTLVRRPYLPFSNGCMKNGAMKAPLLIKGFCRYIQKKDVLTFKVYRGICEITGHKDERVTDFIWLTIEEIKFIRKQPDINKKTGVRDRFFIALMYESGCRDDEILHMKLKNIVINKAGEPDVHIFGKGGKHRCTPLSKDIIS